MCPSLPASHAGCQGCRQRTPARPALHTANAHLRSTPRSGPRGPALLGRLSRCALRCCEYEKAGSRHAPTCSSSWQPPPQGTSLLGQCSAGTRPLRLSWHQGWPGLCLLLPQLSPGVCSAPRNATGGSARCTLRTDEEPQALSSFTWCIESCGPHSHVTRPFHCWAHSHENGTPSSDKHGAWVPAATAARIPRHR